MDAYKTTLIETEEVARDTYAIRLEKPEHFSFEAGQHIGVKMLDPPITDDEGSIRTLSIASPPSADIIELTTRLSDTAFKQSLAKLEKGALFEIDGPYGSMTLHDDADMPAVFLAGGIGITPFISMIREEVATSGGHEIHLFYSNRKPEDGAFIEELFEYEKENDTIDYTPTITRPEGVDKWQGATGYITDTMIEEYIDTPTEPVYYIAGPNEFAKAMEALLKEMDIPELHIRSEIFAGYN